MELYFQIGRKNFFAIKFVLFDGFNRSRRKISLFSPSNALIMDYSKETDRSQDTNSPEPKVHESCIELESSTEHGIEQNYENTEFLGKY